MRSCRRFFGVDHVDAVLERRAPGAAISEERLKELKRTAAPQPLSYIKKKMAEKTRAGAGRLEREPARCWPEWRDDPHPFREHEPMLKGGFSTE